MHLFFLLSYVYVQYNVTLKSIFETWLQVPSQSSLGAEEKWTKANKWACKAMLENEEEARKNQISNWRSKNSDAPAKGCLQVYARSSVDEIWVPMGGDYRHTITCSSTSRYRR